MIAAARALWVTIRNAREWLTLVVVAAIGAWLYVQLAETRADRNQLRAQVDVICASAGSPFAAATVRLTNAKGKTTDVAFARGARCEQQVASLVAFRADTDRTTAEALAAAMREREGKVAVDARAARDAVEALASATKRMEIADAEAQRLNRLDRNWWAAFNDLAGLRDPNH